MNTIEGARTGMPVYRKKMAKTMKSPHARPSPSFSPESHEKTISEEELPNSTLAYQHDTNRNVLYGHFV